MKDSASAFIYGFVVCGSLIAIVGTVLAYAFVNAPCPPGNPHGDDTVLDWSPGAQVPCVHTNSYMVGRLNSHE